jgi:hypothetical protein
VLAGADDKRTVLREQALAAANGVLDERSRRQIPEDFGPSGNSLRIKASVRNPITHV